jgi:hypothetical protein
VLLGDGLERRLERDRVVGRLQRVWPAATSWWAASTRMPNDSSASTMSCRIDVPRSELKSK